MSMVPCPVIFHDIDSRPLYPIDVFMQWTACARPQRLRSSKMRNEVPGQLFTHYFLTDGITTTAQWKASLANPEPFAAFRDGVSQTYAAFSHSQSPNEAQTEEDLIRPVLRLLGWTHYLPQQGVGHEDIPDHLLFADAESKTLAANEPKPAKRFRHAAAVTALRTLQDPAFVPYPRYWINAVHISRRRNWGIGFNDVCNTNNARSVIACIVPDAGFGNTLPILSLEKENADLDLSMLVANLCAFVYDYVARQKIQSRHLNKYILEQLPVVPPDHYEDVRFGPKTAGKIVREACLELTYTSHDMTPFAHNLGYDGPPFVWDEEQRRHLRARLDALYFHLYGLSREDAGYVLETFPIVRREDQERFGTYRTRDLILAYMNALAAGDTETVVAV